MSPVTYALVTAGSVVAAIVSGVKVLLGGGDIFAAAFVMTIFAYVGFFLGLVLHDALRVLFTWPPMVRLFLASLVFLGFAKVVLWLFGGA